MISNFKVKTTKRFYCWIILLICITSKCPQTSSNILQQNPYDANPSSATLKQPKHSPLDDSKHRHISSPSSTEDFYFSHYSNNNNNDHVNHQQSNRRSHHSSINQQRQQLLANDNDVTTQRRRQYVGDEERDEVELRQHHNLEDVSYETSIDKSISKEYNFDSNNNEIKNFKRLLSTKETPNYNVRNPFTDDTSSLKSLFHDDPSLSDMMDDTRAARNVSKRRTKRFARRSFDAADDARNADEFIDDEPLPIPQPLRPIVRGPFESEQGLDDVSVIYVEPRQPVTLACEVDLDIQTTAWLKDDQIVQAIEPSLRGGESRFVKEPNGALRINSVMLEDNGLWKCEAENFRGYTDFGRPIKLVVLSPPRPPYLLFESRRLDASNLFIPIKENAEIALSCVSEGGNPKPLLTWEILLNPTVDHHALKLPPESLEMQVSKQPKEKEKDYKVNSGAKSDAKIPVIYRAHHSARVICVMEHPSLKMRLNATIVLDVQYTPSFAITRTPGFGYPLREGIPVSLKCDVDSNPPSTAMWQKDDGDPPMPQSGDGLLNFTAIKREDSGWYKCTARHLNKPYSSFGYFLNVRYDALDVTSEPDDQNQAIASSSSLTQSRLPLSSAHVASKFAQLEVELGGSVTLQCPQGSLGCWSHFDPVTSRLKGLGVGTYSPSSNGQYALKDVVYQDAGIYKCIGQSPTNKKKLEVLNAIALGVKGFPTVTARNNTPTAHPGLPLHLFVEFCANPPAHAARWLHGDRIYTPGNQYGSDILAYAVTDNPVPFCKEARLTIVHMHEKVARTFYFVVSTPAGVAETVININYTAAKNHNKRITVNTISNNNLPIFSSSANYVHANRFACSVIALMTLSWLIRCSSH